ncbi:oligosaccharide flippase family protein [Alkalicoccobacillus porphyridii]|uniref:Polysaccharide biosynthesis protein n=1 Tax=Alkalicoccobacillus porphyridii TaxID=2597270 RepID=A0A554A3V9_9BACI|nr:oligosaccharide flippase family protein [Alkalicoccobacillus porphyridii]TSB48373.1 polysaccharide biosynthesis protein [Alkalicoccobacillus porphyridii]
MLARHAFAYLLSHGTPALVGFAAIAVYTRLLSDTEYGTYALVFAIAAMMNAIVFEWLKVSFLRYFASYQEKRKLMETVKLTFLLLAGATTFLALPLYFFMENLSWVHILLAFVLSWSQSWYQLNLSLIRSEFNPQLYGYLAFSRSILSMLFGVVLIVAGFAELGLLWGLVLSFAVTLIWPTLNRWKLRMHLQQFDTSLLKSFASYGLPLAITLLLAVVIHNSDRFIISAMMGVGANGTYSATYDLTEQTIFTLMMVINLAAFPIALKAMESKGEAEALLQVKENTGLLLLIALPAMAGMILITPNAVSLMLGEAFREDALVLMPFIAVGAFLKGFKLYSVDIIFHLHKNMSIQLLPVLIAAVLNVALTIWLIPPLGLVGAAVATITAYAIAIILSLFFMRIPMRTFPFPYKDFVKILLAVVGMTVALWPLRSFIGIGWLSVQLIIALMVYGGIVWLTNTLQIRRHAHRILHNKRKM